MKNKKIMCGTILLLFVMSGLCNIISVSAESIDLPPSSYWARGFDVDYQDEIELSISSSGIINIYIMNEEQLNILTDSGGLTWNYLKRWKDITYLEHIYTILTDGKYYVVLYNKDIFYGRTVDLQITIDYYVPYEPYDSSNNILKNVFFFVIIPIAIVIVIVIGIIILKLPRRTSKKKVSIQEKVIPEITYCSECGAEIDKERMYCSRCGSKIKN